jgi:predicted nucleic acid-binding protein
MIQTEMSADTRAIADLLAAAPVGATVSHAAMSAAIGRDVTTCRHIVTAARRAAQREAGAVFVTERGTGYRRLPAEEVARVVGSNARQHIRRTAGRAKRALTAGTARANDLPPAVQRQVAAEVSALALIEHISRDAAVKPSDDAPTKPTPVAVTARNLLTAIGARQDNAA